MRHYNALKSESDRLGLPTRFVEDLTVHDRDQLQDLPDGEPFGWALRASGTHLFLPGTQDGVGHTVDQFPSFVREAFTAPVRFYWWDGQRLRAVPEATLTRRLRQAAND